MGQHNKIGHQTHTSHIKNILFRSFKSSDRQKIMDDIFSHRVTVIGLFGKEKSYDSNKAIEVFDNLAQRDIFSSMERCSDEVFIIIYFMIKYQYILMNIGALLK